MPKVIPGTSHEALAFMLQHWRNLFKISAIPIAIYMLGGWFQINAMVDMYRKMATFVHGDRIDPAFIGSYMRMMGFSMLISFFGLFAITWIFVRIVRFHDSDQAGWFNFDKSSVKATLMTLVYAIGITMLSGLSYMAMFIVLMLLVAIFGAVANGAVVGVVAVVGVFAAIGTFQWVLFRFLVGLPGVALGHSPDFFRDLWPLSRGESWAVPLRVWTVTLATYVPFMVILAWFVLPPMMDLAQKTRPGGAPLPPDVVFPLIADMMESFKPAMAFSVLLLLPLAWFLSLLMAISFRRFRDRQK